MKIFSNGDKVIIFFVMFIAVISYVLFSVFLFDDRADTIEIFTDGKLYASYNLASAKDEVVEIKTKYGTNQLKISQNGAEMIKASCPDKRDVKMGKITKAGQVLICVPNRVVVKLTSQKKAEVDRVTY
ncbi:MAG: NusG domain II-containing protein [Clostridia bacterium]|nr:NusG domain II-containing protein [Clostridia bacterium]